MPRVRSERLGIKNILTEPAASLLPASRRSKSLSPKVAGRRQLVLAFQKRLNFATAGRGGLRPQPGNADRRGGSGGLDQRVVTLDDQRKTIYMTVGGSFLLQLGKQYDWTVKVSDNSVLSRGAQGVYTAHRAGTITLTATGDPTCRKSTPACTLPSRLFSVTIEVSN